MNIVCIGGGLGNQMSQYAFYLSQKAKKKCINLYQIRRKSEHNGYELRCLFNVLDEKPFPDIIVRFVRKLRVFHNRHTWKYIISAITNSLRLIGINIVLEPQNYQFYKKNLSCKRGLNIFYGVFQSEKYFKHNEKQIRETFRFDVFKLNDLSKECLSTIAQANNSVSIHIRRGDFINAGHIEKWGKICTTEYYNNAIAYISERVQDPVFFVFSDDIAWSKENLNVTNPVFVEHNKGNDSWQDMFLISQCKHHINANSSFSWWGAWLGENKDKIVVVPQKFISTCETPDIYPEEWIKI